MTEVKMSKTMGRFEFCAGNSLRISSWGIRVFCCGLLLASIALSGCKSEPAPFRQNMAYKKKMERAYMDDTEEKPNPLSPDLTRDVASILETMFGTPDSPRMPAIEGFDLDKLVDLHSLQMAAGPVASNQGGAAQGLYREHCVHCHGISGDGNGPTAAFLNPYPRDYRMGIYKFKSTKKGEKPTNDDLKRIVNNGVAGTAMPSFALLPEAEVDALIDYVKYLSVRGEVERKLFAYATNELEENQTRLFTVGADAASTSEADKTKLKEQLQPYLDMAKDVMEAWTAGKSVAVPEPPHPLDPPDPAAIVRGRAIFYGPVANCFSCHGESGLGDGQRDFYDDWSGEWVEKGKTDTPAVYLKQHILPPRNLIPRNLRLGLYRGGRRPVDLYWRLVNGIDGAQMPAVPLLAEGDPPGTKKLSQQDLWDLIAYVRSLPYESISRPAKEESQALKELQ
jgi:mono/diheme cytochrome c family protein